MENLDYHIDQINESTVTALARSYNILNYSHDLKTILSSLFPDKDFSSHTKLQLHKIINEILTNRFKGESGLKAKLVDMFVKKRVTAAFEIKVNNSRVDFLTINGETRSYEIKSGLDNLYKLAKQMSDYEKVFEFNYVVIDEKHLQNAIALIPEHYGIYVMEGGKLTEKKTADKNSCLQPEKQLQLFTKKELTRHFEAVESSSTKVLEKVSPGKINECFKTMLKSRYEKKWQFLKENKNEILPIDYQFFFHHNIEPKVIYGA